ncbi:MAG: sigma-70 family RNA polymerase sigma factor [Candidatus Rokuibacteriota bacterium]
MSPNEGADFHRLTLDHLDSLYNYARVLTRKPEDAEDLLHEALARAFRAFRRFDPLLSYKAWMFTIIKNAHIDHQRRRRNGVVEDSGGEWAVEALSAESPLSSIPLAPDDILLRQETIGQVRAAIRRLPPALQEVVELRDIEGFSYQEIARIVDRPLGTVMSRLYRGRNLLRTYLVEPQRAGHRGARGLSDGL